MNYVIQLGPVGLNGFILLVLAAWLAGSFALKLLSRLTGLNTDIPQTLLEGALLSGAITARLFFVIQFWASFSAKPWQALFFWQGGFNAWGALIGAAAFIAFKLFLLKQDQRPQIALLTGFALLLTTSAFYSGRWLVNQQQTELLSPVMMAAELTDRQNNPVPLNNYQGQPVVINFWATWCPPCRREMPLLETSFALLKQQGVALLLINVGESGEIIEQYLQANDLNVPVLKNGNHLTDQLFSLTGAKVMPTTLFINAQGKVIHSRVGELSAATLQQGVNKIVEF